MKIPFDINPRRFPFFYGYLIIFVGAIGAFMSAPGQTIGVSVFTDHLIEAFGLTRVQLAWTYLVGTISSAFILTFGGKLYDKYGARIVATLAGVGLGLALLLLTSIDILSERLQAISSLPKNYATIGLLVLGFFGIRFFGQGMLTMVSRNMAMKWFDKKRGLASAFFGVALVLGFSVVPKIFSWLIDNYQWRASWQITAFVVGVCFSLFALVFFRDNPQKYGLKPDGDLASKKKKKNNNKKRLIATGHDFELKEAIRTYSFWVFTLTMVMFGLYLTAFTFHIEDLFVSAGLTKKDAISVFIPTAIIAVGIELTTGFIADYVKMKYILYFELAGLLLSTIAASMLNSGGVIVLIIIGNSMAQGVFGILTSVTWPRFFGTKHLGAISGFASSWIVAGSAVGPLLFSYSKEFFGSYSAGILICGSICAILLVLSFKADNASEKFDRKEELGN